MRSWRRFWNPWAAAREAAAAARAAAEAARAAAAAAAESRSAAPAALDAIWQTNQNLTRLLEVLQPQNIKPAKGVETDGTESVPMGGVSREALSRRANQRIRQSVGSLAWPDQR